MHDAVLHVLYVVDEDVVTAYSGDEYVDEAEGPEHGLEEHGEETLSELRSQASTSRQQCNMVNPPRPSLRTPIPTTWICSYSVPNADRTNIALYSAVLLTASSD